MTFAVPPEDPGRFLPLLIVLFLAFLVPLLLGRFKRLPVVVGEIIAGVIVGPSVLAWVSDGPILTFMGDIGLAFLMFLAGLEIDFDMLFPGKKGGRSNGPNVGLLALLVYGITLALAIPGAILINRIGLTGDMWLLVFILSATSLGVLLPILKERDMLSERFGQTVFITAMLADFITVLLLTVYLITSNRGFDPEVFSLGLLFLAFILFYRFGPGLVRIPAVRRIFNELSRATIQIKIRGAIVILMSFVVLAEFVDAELILGAFLAGMIISLLKGSEDEPLVHKLEAFGFGFFIPVFFILVGIDLDLQALAESPESLLSLPQFFLIAIAVKLLPMFFMRKFFSWREIFGGGLLLNTHLSLEVAIAVIGLRAGLFDAATATTVIVFSVVTVVLMPLLFGIILPFTKKEITRYVLIVGGSDLGLRVAQELRAHGEEVRFIEHEARWKQTVEEKGFAVIQAAARADSLDLVKASEVKSLLLLGKDEQNSLEIGRAACGRDIRNVIALVRDPEKLEDFQHAGIKPFTPAIQRATMITMMALNPDVYTLLTSAHEDRTVRRMTIKNPSIAGRKLRELPMPGDLLVLALRRETELIIPRGDTVLNKGDSLTLVGNTDAVDDIRELLEKA